MARINKIPALNGIRALSVLLVVISHSGFGDIIPGGFGVTVFFFLSGYLITTLFINEIKQAGTINIKNFFIRRLVRLYPPFFISLIAAYSLSYFNVIGGQSTWVGAISQVFYFANYLNIFFDGIHLTPSGTGIYWSLAVEEHFYLVYPFVIYLFVSTSKKNQLPFLLISVVLIVLIWRYYLYNHNALFTSRILFATDTRIDSIIFGCILAILKNPLTCIARKLSKKDVFLLVLSLAVLLVTFIYRDPGFRHTLKFSLQGGAISILFYYAIAFHQYYPFAWLKCAFFEKMGLYSYSIYLVHYLIIEVIEDNFSDTINGFIVFPVVLLLSLFVSSLIYKFVEKPTHKYRVKYR